MRTECFIVVKHRSTNSEGAADSSPGREPGEYIHTTQRARSGRQKSIHLLRGLSPLRGLVAKMLIPGLTPGATICRSFGACYLVQNSPSSKDSSLTTSYKVVASLREVWRAVGTSRTRRVVSLLCRRMRISSPAFTAWADLAGFPLIETRPASQSFWANDRRPLRRLALRKRSRRTVQSPEAVGRSRKQEPKLIEFSSCLLLLPSAPDSTVSGRFRGTCPSSSRAAWRYHRFPLSFPARGSATALRWGSSCPIT